MALLDSVILNIFASRIGPPFSGEQRPRAEFPLRKDQVKEVPLLAGDVIYPYLEEAEGKLSEARLLALAEESGLGRFSSLEELKSSLNFRLEHPESACRRFGSELVKEGVSYDRAVFNMLVHRTSPGMYYRGMFSVLSYLSSQPLNKEWLDTVSLAYFTMDRYEHINCNAVSVDAILEERSGNRRRARVIYLHFFDSTLGWFEWNHTFQVARHYPSIFGEPPAEVSHRFSDEFVIADPFFPERPPLKLPLRPSLEDIAKRLGAELSREGPLLLLNGEPIAVPDYHPERFGGEGLYRALRDVRVENGRVIIKEPDSLFRRYHDLVLVKGHRYHLSRALPTFEFICDYRVNRGRHLALTLFAKACSFAWRLFTGGENGNLWGELLFMLLQAGDGPPPGLWETGYREPGSGSAGRGELLSVSERLLVFSERYGLSPREREVLTRLVEGKSNREIAEELFISERTVKSHVASILNKSGLNSRSRLLAEIMWW